MIIFVQRGTDGPIRILYTPSAPGYARNLMNPMLADVHLIGQRRNRRGLLQRLREMFKASYISHDCYAPTPALLEFIAAGDTLPLPRSRKRRLNIREALEIFRACHEGTEGDGAIGARYGISPVSVGAVARGQTHAGLFRRREDPADKRYYFVSEAIDGAKEYRLMYGRRAR